MLPSKCTKDILKMYIYYIHLYNKKQIDITGEMSTFTGKMAAFTLVIP